MAEGLDQTRRKIGENTMVTKKRGILWAMLMLVFPMRSQSQEVLRLPKERITAFVTRIGGMNGARATILAKPTSQFVREAVADSVVAIANYLPPGSELPELSAADAFGVLLGVARSDVPGVSEIGYSRLIRMALNGNTPLVRMTAITMLAMLDDKVKGASALKTVATSRSDAAPEAVRILGSSYGPVGVSTLRGIFSENSAVDKEAAGVVGAFAKRYKWSR